MHANLCLRNSSRENQLVVPHLTLASSFIERSVGLLKYSTLPDDEGLWISNCSSIHMFFMRFAIDAVFVDKNLVIKKIYSDLQPWRMTFPVFGADSVFELPSGKAKQTCLNIGDQLHVGH